MNIKYHLNEVLKEKRITKKYLQEKLKISSKTMSKFNKNESVSLNTIASICTELNCQIGDIIEIEKEPSLILSKLLEEKNIKLPNSLYHETQILFAYNSNRIEGSQLSEEDTRYIYETNTVEGIKNTNDIIEVINHFRAFDYLLDTIFDPLNEDLIKKFHKIIKSNTTDSRLDWFNVGEYKSQKNTVGGFETATPNAVAAEMKKLINSYNLIKNKSVENIIDFHVKFERIHPFQDGNGRVGRLIMFRECLKESITPFIIEDDLKYFYYRGLSKYDEQKGYLVDTCLTSQDKITELLKLYI